MAPILIVYGTTDGHTGKIAETLAEDLRQEGAVVDVMDAAANTVFDPVDYAGVVVAASVHIGSYQRPVRRWVKAHRAALESRRSAFLSVCLGVLDPSAKAKRDLAAILDRFLAETGWRPDFTRSVAGAVLYTRYNWVKRWMMRRIVRAYGGATDTTRDFEYTDWNDLCAFAHTFYGSVTGGERMEAPLRATG